MLFNSAIFLVFFVCVLLLYWCVFKKQRLWVLLISGCIFYGNWDWRFLILLFFTSGVDFLAAKMIHTETQQVKAKAWLVLSVSVNILTLCIFKYYNFFAESFAQLLSLFRLKPSFTTLHVVLPVGISFYTFQSIAYVTDVYRRRIEPEYSALRYFAFICFFPQMVAGPIERARRMLPQFRTEKTLNRSYFESGINLMLYGFFQKVVIADNLALLVDRIHENIHANSSWMLAAGILAFAIQIYADFCGYSNIARGTAQLLGFKLSKNFYFPYFSGSFKKFWQRWHISLSTWFRDYVYIPLGGNRGSKARRNTNLILTFLLSGLWHGANFTFILWGFFHGLFLVLEKMLGSKRDSVLKSVLVFVIVAVLFTLFRSPDPAHFFEYVGTLFAMNTTTTASQWTAFESGAWFLVPLLGFVALEIIRYHKKGLGRYRYNYSTNVLLILLILLFAVFENAPRFIYFQF